jgi:transposase-like protein
MNGDMNDNWHTQLHNLSIEESRGIHIKPDWVCTDCGREYTYNQLPHRKYAIWAPYCEDCEEG